MKNREPSDYRTPEYLNGRINDLAKSAWYAFRAIEVLALRTSIDPEELDRLSRIDELTADERLSMLTPESEGRDLATVIAEAMDEPEPSEFGRLIEEIRRDGEELTRRFDELASRWDNPASSDAAGPFYDRSIRNDLAKVRNDIDRLRDQLRLNAHAITEAFREGVRKGGGSCVS